MLIFGLKEEIVQKIKEIFAQFEEVEEVIVYGSRAMGNFRNGSDLDLTIKGQKMNVGIVNKISIKIDDLYLPYLFDISVYHQITNLELIDHIERVGKVFYEKHLIEI